MPDLDLVPLSLPSSNPTSAEPVRDTLLRQPSASATTTHISPSHDMANPIRREMFIPDSISAADTMIAGHAYQAGAQSMLDPLIEGPELPADVTIAQLRLL